ncbi:MAG: hypothetical protein AAF682_26020 [Planctomycetota bacterium]
MAIGTAGGTGKPVLAMGERGQRIEPARIVAERQHPGEKRGPGEHRPQDGDPRSPDPTPGAPAAPETSCTSFAAAIAVGELHASELTHAAEIGASGARDAAPGSLAGLTLRV